MISPIHLFRQNKELKKILNQEAKLLLVAGEVAIVELDSGEELAVRLDEEKLKTGEKIHFKLQRVPSNDGPVTYIPVGYKA